MQFTATQVTVLFWLGIAFVVVGGCLMVWSVAESRRTAGVDINALTKLLNAIASLVNALASYFPHYAGRVGTALVLIGLFMIFYPMQAVSG